MLPNSALMISEAKRLHDLGFAIHWLRSKSKLPTDNKWTTGPRKTWEQLDARKRKDQNMGVRLGHPSQLLDGTYLAVIDCDVKSTLKAHRLEMEAKLTELIGEKCPLVISGRGNGSRHLYIRTKEPVHPFRYSQSEEKVRVHMPSAPRSGYERRKLRGFELQQGVRLRAAWEISVMGDGQQVVLPPSVHPDSGKEYAWQIPIHDVTDIPLFELGSSKRGPARRVNHDFKEAEIDLLTCTDLPEDVIELILGGKDCEDRSAGLYSACIAMVKARYSDNQILTVLTDPDTFLGQCAYEHTKSSSRERAAKWVMSYTLAKVREELDAEKAFADEEAHCTLLPEAAARQREKIVGRKPTGDELRAARLGEVGALPKTDISWESKIERQGNSPEGRPVPSFKNVMLILTHAAGADVFKRDNFSMVDHYGHKAPWGGRKGLELRDIDLILIKDWFAHTYRFEPATSLILEVVQKISASNGYHPVLNYVDRLKWDGKPRLDTWLKDYLGATGPDEYLEAVGRKTLVAMIARVREPGVKFDTVLVLEGPQGCGKSSAVKILADPWFSDAMINIGDKDAVLAMRLAWVMELGELSSMRKADIDQLKQFISQPTDRIRVPYGKLTESFPRQSIFIGTTNSEEYLKDTTGNRRFWPVRVSKVLFKKLTADRDQLIAEADVAYKLGEPLYLEDKEVEKVAMKEQAQRVFEDAWVGLLDGFLRKSHDNFDVTQFTIEDLFGEYGAFNTWKCTKGEQMRAADALRGLGYAKRRVVTKLGRRWLWTKNE